MLRGCSGDVEGFTVFGMKTSGTFLLCLMVIQLITVVKQIHDMSNEPPITKTFASNTIHINNRLRSQMERPKIENLSC